MRTTVRTTIVAIVTLFALVTSAQATFVGLQRVVKLDLVRATLVNVADAAGTWQHAGGEVFFRGTKIGNYALHRRVTTGGTNAQNTAMFTMTIFFTDGTTSAPQNITLQGSHSFTTGQYVGSVSGASRDYLMLQGNHFIGDTSTDVLRIYR